MSLSARESRAFRNCFLGALALFGVAVGGEFSQAPAPTSCSLDSQKEQVAVAVLEHLHGPALVRGTGQVVAALLGHLLGGHCD
jgi:hypothetical protein